MPHISDTSDTNKAKPIRTFHSICYTISLFWHSLAKSTLHPFVLHAMFIQCENVGYKFKNFISFQSVWSHRMFVLHPYLYLWIGWLYLLYTKNIYVCLFVYVDVWMGHFLRDKERLTLQFLVTSHQSIHSTSLYLWIMSNKKILKSKHSSKQKNIL